MSATQEVGEIFATSTRAANATLRSPTILICLVFLWGMNMWFFRIFGIDYVKVLHHDLKSRTEQHDHSSDQEEKEKDCEVKRASSSSLAALDHYPRSNSTSTPHPDDEEITFAGGSVASDSEKGKDESSGARVMFFAGTLLINLHVTHYFWSEWMGGSQIGASMAFYGGVATAMLAPSSHWLRRSTWIVVQRAWQIVQCHIRRPVPFIDVFFADSMCSLSKVFFDWGMSIHLAQYYPEPVPPSVQHIILPSLAAAAPYLIRSRQCFAMWTVTGDSKHVLNGIKYASSILPLILSACQKALSSDRLQGQLETVLVVVLIFNATYALWWDIGKCKLHYSSVLLTERTMTVMDWGMMQNAASAASYFRSSERGQTRWNTSGHSSIYSSATSRLFSGWTAGATVASLWSSGPQSCWNVLLRKRLRYGVQFSVMILLVDTLLRFSWVLRFFHNLFPSNDSFVLLSQFLEVFRRALWNLLRIEWENMKQTGYHIPSQHSRVTMSMMPTVTVFTTDPYPRSLSQDDDDDKTNIVQNRRREREASPSRVVHRHSPKQIAAVET